jgi:hypothetical protein
MIRSLLTIIGTLVLWALSGFKGKIDNYSNEPNETTNALIGALVILVVFILLITLFGEKH